MKVVVLLELDVGFLVFVVRVGIVSGSFISLVWIGIGEV